MHYALRLSLLAAVLLARPSLLPAGDPAEAPFGFAGMEIFRASSESIGLRAIDLNGDGLTDLVYADNEDATIRLLIQVVPGKPASIPTAVEAQSVPGGRKRSVNELPSDERFRVERFYTEKKVIALQVADLDGDGKPDLAYYGDPKEMEVVYQSGEWGSRREKFAISDGAESSEALAAADLNGDGRTDLVLLGSGKTYLFRQRREGGGLEKPQVIYNAFSDATSVLVGDLNDDKKPDLVLLRPRASHPFVLRFQTREGGGFGPEVAVKSLPLHHARLSALEGAERADLLAIQGNTHRIRALRWAKPKQSSSPPLSEPRLYALRPDADASLRRIELGDVNGDGRADLLATCAETAEVDVYLQDARGELGPPVAFPTLAEVKGIAVADLDGDGAREVVVVSAREKALGVSRWLPAGGGRLSIPDSYTVEGDPLLVAARGAQMMIVFKGADGKYHLSGRSVTRSEGQKALFDVPFEAGADPGALVLFDADGDGQLDALVLVPYEDPRLFVRQAGEGFQFREASKGKDFGIGQVSRLTPATFTLAAGLSPLSEDPAAGADARRGTPFLVAQKSYARALALDAGGRLKVLEQFTGRGAAADIAGAAALNLDDDPEREVLLFDRAEAAVEILDREPQGTYRTVRSISTPGFEFAGFRVLDLNGDGREDAAMIGKQAVAVLYQGAVDGELEEFARYDADEKFLGEGQQHGLPELLAVGDLNGDAVRDIVFATEPLYLLAFLSPEGAASRSWGLLHSRLAFPIFEEKSFMRRQGGQGPREILVADVTGDGKADLLLLVHDRILLYPQE